MLPTSVAVHGHDCLATPVASCNCGPVLDAEGFVWSVIGRLGLKLADHEREELALDGIEALYRLSSRYVHQRPGYAQPGRFDGWAARMLPRRLLEAWHDSNPEHRRIKRPDGTTYWRYYPRPMSLDGPDEQDHDHHRITPHDWLPFPDSPATGARADG